MSKIANTPVQLPAGVDVSIDDARFSVKGPKGTLELPLDGSVAISQNSEERLLSFKKTDDSSHAKAMSGTVRALVNNMVKGVTTGFERRLVLQGVGYRGSISNKKLNLSLGFSHPVMYQLPDSVDAEMPSQTEIILRCSDKALLGQTAATIRAFRPPEPYKGKGVHFDGEYVRRKEAKKKK